MKRRQKLRRKTSKKMFRKGASRTHKYNTTEFVMRGGIRL